MHLCFVCPGAADLFTPAGRSAGGTERQQRLIGRELARRGHRVTFAVRAIDGLTGDDRVDVAGVRLRADLPRGVGRVLNTARLWSALRAIAPDGLVQQGADPLTLDVALFARAARARFAFMAASDDDFLLRVLHRSRPRNWLYRRGIALADVVIAQTARQRELARDRFGLDAAVVPNPVEIPADVPPPGEEALWVGMLRPEKRPGMVLALARALPRVRFTVVGGAPATGGPAVASAAEAFRREAAAFPNVVCAGFQPPDRLDAFYARAAVVLNTSLVEGFSNVLLEGWARGRPAVTCGVDPDEVICRHGLGVHARNLAEMAKALEKLLADDGRRAAMGAAARRYVETRHAIGPVVDRYEAIFGNL